MSRSGRAFDTAQWLKEVMMQTADHSPATWNGAYRLALANSALFLVLAGISVAAGLTSISWNCTVATIFFVGAMISAQRLFRAGGGLVAVAFFVAGAGLLFGFGTAYTPFTPRDSILSVLFTADEQRRMLPKINFVNATSVFIVLLTARFIANVPADRLPGSANIAKILHKLSPHITLILALSWGVVALQIATFPQPGDMLLRGALNVLGRLPLVALLLIFSERQRYGAGVVLAAVLLAVFMSAIGLASTSKTAALLPMAAVVAALALQPRDRPWATALGIAVALTYFLWLAPASTQARQSLMAAGAPDSLSGNFEAVFAGSDAPRTEGNGVSALAARFSSAPYQSYLINRYDSGVRGHSLDDAWTALVPRVIWPEKPNITRFGAELYSEINRRLGRSQLAPSYTGEAYWNYGWWGVVAVSVLLGLQVGWLSKEWLSLTAGNDKKVGILAFAIPVVFNYFWVETWTSASYVGGFITLVVLIKATDIAAARATAGPAYALRGVRRASTQS